MSVTFWMPQAPLIRVEPYPEDEPGYLEERPAEPFLDINMANSNAADLIRLVNPGADTVCGEWYEKEIRATHRRVMLLLNKTPERFMSDEDRQGNLIYCGRGMDYVTRRLTEFLTLLTVALEHGFYVAYG